MDSDNFVAGGVILIVMTFIVGIGAAIWLSESGNQEYRMSCIAAGKSVINGSCVKVAP
jgi:ABC-type phosphate transport system permease subunit